MSPKPPHSLQTSNPSDVLANNLPSPWQRGQKVIPYFSGPKVLSISFLPSRPSEVYPDLLSSTADSPESPGQQSPRRSNISTPRAVHGDRKICHRTWHPLQRRHFVNSNLPIKSPPFPPGGIRCGTSFHRALGAGSLPPEVP